MTLDKNRLTVTNVNNKNFNAFSIDFFCYLNCVRAFLSSVTHCVLESIKIVKRCQRHAWN